MDSTDNFAFELEKMINQVSEGKEVISMDETQKRQFIYTNWLKNMAHVLRALKRNQKIIMDGDYDDDSTMEPVMVLLRQHAARSPDRMIFLPVYDQSGMTPEESAKMVNVEYWPPFFQESDDYDYNSDNGAEIDLWNGRRFTIADLSFKKELAKFIAGKVEC